MADDGPALVLDYAGNKVEADNTVAELRAMGASVQADVADETAVSSLFDLAHEQFGGVDVVVHAAGIMPLSLLVDMDLDVLDRVLRTNVRGTFVVDQQAARRRVGHQLLQLDHAVLASRVHRLRREQGRRRGDHLHAGPRAART